ncbi:MAG: hypothetical protein AUJ90_02080 [Gallionellaceae bacterium CG1_02_60_948]|nr:MAG: hypothetical protein AUJ90_02080 [Gallionellaceae bacterium CG1_02_60_948]
MLSFLYVVRFNIRYVPNIPWIFPKRITGILTSFRAFKIFFSRIFLRHPDGIKVEDIILGVASKPNHGFIAPRQSTGGVQSMFKAPNDAVAHYKAKIVKDWEE